MPTIGKADELRVFEYNAYQLLHGVDFSGQRFWRQMMRQVDELWVYHDVVW